MSLFSAKKFPKLMSVLRKSIIIKVVEQVLVEEGMGSNIISKYANQNQSYFFISLSFLQFTDC